MNELTDAQKRAIETVKENKVSDLISSCKSLASSFGNLTSEILIKSIHDFVEDELNELELDDSVRIRILDGVFERSESACILLNIVESTEHIKIQERKLAMPESKVSSLN